MDAKVDNGVLKICIGKSAEKAKSRKISITGGGGQQQQSLPQASGGGAAAATGAGGNQQQKKGEEGLDKEQPTKM